MKIRLRHGLATAALTLICLLAGTLTAFASTENGGPADEPAVHTDTSQRDIPQGPGRGEAEEPAAPQEGTLLGSFEITAYCGCTLCCPAGHPLTYAGTVPQAAHTISADLDHFPLGTKLRIGETIYTVEDCGSAVIGNVLDIYFDTHEEALAYGRQTADVYLIEMGA